MEDYRKADLTPADRAMLDFAVKLTRSPRAVTDQVRVRPQLVERPYVRIKGDEAPPTLMARMGKDLG